MSKTIYYFTATGNSLQAALDIADGLGDTEVISMTKAGMNVKCDSETVGFVFPVFAWGMPRMVKDFIASGSFSKDSYFFAVATCGASTGGTFVDVDSLLRKKEAKLSYCKKLLSVSNYIPMYDVNTETIDTVLKNSEIELAKIIGEIKEGKVIKIKRGLGLIRVVHRGIIKSYNIADKSYNVSDSCVSCGTCASVCPARNIVLEEGKPVFQHNCEHCVACLHWCPQKALNYKDKTQNRDRYHHPKVKAEQLP